MRPFSTMMSIGPIGGAPVPSMMVALRSASRLNGPTPRSREVAFRDDRHLALVADARQLIARGNFRLCLIRHDRFLLFLSTQLYLTR